LTILHAGGADAQDVGVLGEVVDDLRVGHIVGELKRVDVGVDVLVVGAGDIEVDVHRLYAAGLEVLVDVFDGLDAVDEADFQLLGHAHVDDALHHDQNYEHEDAADDGDHVVAEADGDAQTGGVPEGGCGGKAGDLSVGEQDGAGAEETDAADDLRAQSAEAVGDVGASVGGKSGNEAGFDQRDGAGAQADQNVGSHTCGTVLDLSLDTDDRADQYRESNAKDDDRVFHVSPPKDGDETVFALHTDYSNIIAYYQYNSK